MGRLWYGMGKAFVYMSVFHDNPNLTGIGKSRFFLSTDHEKDWIGNYTQSK